MFSSHTDGTWNMQIKKVQATKWQKIFWVEWQLNPESTVYNLSGLSLNIEGNLNQSALEKTLFDLVNYYLEGCRTRFIEENDVLFQLISDHVDPDIQVWDIIATKSAKDREQKKREFIDTIAKHRFNLIEGPLFRFGLLKDTATKNLLIINFHHIIMDGYTGRRITGILTELYNHYAHGDDKPKLPEINIADYIAKAQPEFSEESLNYWVNLLKNKSLYIDLPFFTQEKSKEHKVKSQYFELDESETLKIKRVSKSLGATPFIFLSAIYALIIGRYTNSKDVPLSYPVNMRPSTKPFNDVFGCFINTIPAAVNLDDNLSFKELVNNLTQQRKESRKHVAISFSEIIHALRTEEQLSNEDIFNISLGETTIVSEGLKFKDLKVEIIVKGEDSVFDLFLAYQITDKIEFRLEYLAGFDSRLINNFIDNFKILLFDAIARLEQNIYKLSVMSKEQEHQCLIDYNKTDIEYPKDKTIHQLFV